VGVCDVCVCAKERGERGSILDRLGYVTLYCVERESESERKRETDRERETERERQRERKREREREREREFVCACGWEGVYDVCRCMCVSVCIWVEDGCFKISHIRVCVCVCVYLCFNDHPYTSRFSLMSTFL